MVTLKRSMSGHKHKVADAEDPPESPGSPDSPQKNKMKELTHLPQLFQRDKPLGVKDWYSHAWRGDVNHFSSTMEDIWFAFLFLRIGTPTPGAAM